MKDTIRKIIKEADSSRFAGYYNGPLTMGEIDWEKSALGPFTKKVSNFFNADLQYDSYDGTLDSHKKDSKKLETKSKRISKYNKKHPQANDEDGGIINQTPGKGKKIVPIKEWVELDSIDLNEDLAVWFGKKKKPKGSKQPKGPWVNICRKVDGKHPPCGRSDTSKGEYPKCRAAGVAGKMSDSEKRSACQQKRNAEKKDTQTGKGQKPVMTSYKKKKTNEDMKRIVRLTENDLSRIVKRVLVEQQRGEKGDIITQDYRTEKDKDRKKRIMYSDSELQTMLNNCMSSGTNRSDKTRLQKECQNDMEKNSFDQWKDVFYGFKGMEKSREQRVVIAKGNLDANDTSGSYRIEYNCGNNQINYLKNNSPWSSNTLTQEQTNRDINWLSGWCDRINWNSRIGQDRKLFRNPKIY